MKTASIAALLLLVTAPIATAQTCRLVKDFNPTSYGWPNQMAASFGKKMYLSVRTPDEGYEPWILDGAGYRLLKVINPGRVSSQPHSFTSFWNGSRVLTVFTAIDAQHGVELWITDGTTAGTRLLKDIAPGAQHASPSNFTVCDGQVLFTADDRTHGRELFVTDGTSAGTKLVRDILPGSGTSRPGGFVTLKGRAYFVATDSRGQELWCSDGTPAGTRLVKDIRAGAGSSSPRSLTRAGEKILFSANGPGGREPWISDGTEAGTKQLKDIHVGGDSNPGGFTHCNGRYCFSAMTPELGSELWSTDLTEAGTMLVAETFPGTTGGSPGHFADAGGFLFFRAYGPAGREPYRTDGTKAGTVMLKDVRSGNRHSYGDWQIAAGNGVYFDADDGVTGKELWFTDGTPAGTRQVRDIKPGPGDSIGGYADFELFNGNLYFRADDGVHNFELWAVEGVGTTEKTMTEGSRGAFPTLDATPPVAGKPSTYTYGCGPMNHVGLVWVGQLRDPKGHALFANGGHTILDIFQGVNWFMGAVLPPRGSFRLAIPDGPRLHGMKYAAQILWARVGTIAPIQTSNGIVQTIGR